MAAKVELRRFADGRLMLVVFFTESSNLWKHDNNTFSWVPSKQELELINGGLEAIDSYNIFKKNLRELKAKN